MKQKEQLFQILLGPQQRKVTQIELSKINKKLISDKSHSEYLIKNLVWTAYQQDLVVQYVDFVFYNVCRLYCTRLTVCIIQDVQRVFTSKSSVDKEDFYIKSDIIKSKKNML